MSDRPTAAARLLTASAALAALGLAACPASTPAPASDGSVDDTSLTDVASTDSQVTGDSASGDGQAEVEVAADVGDASQPDAPDADAASDAEADTAVLPGAFGWPCDSNDDCDSGYCLEGYAERVCSEVCSARCPAGWSCRRDLSSGSDDTFVCVLSFPHLCSPCDTNAECEADASPGSRCLPRGGDGSQGSFCGGACAAGSCPPGYLCKASVDVGGEVTPQCVPEDDAVCSCSPRAVAAGATTTCSLTADLGTCLGERACTAAGLTDCDARTPALDDCNGQDDDCDGETDEAYLPGPCTIDNAWGSCPGTTRCGFDAGTECVGPTPARESCGDAIDSDCDGESDDEDAAGCTPFYVDLDGDGFGVGAPRCLCAPSGDYAAPVGGDCDDAHGNARPNGSEVCDGLDNDCDGQTDDAGAIGCSIFFHDGDGDHFGDPDDFACLCAPDAAHGYSATAGSDCDDGDDHANPSAPEVCDGKDDDCDTLVDEEGAVGCALHFADGDGDGWGDSTASACLCAPEAAFPLTRGGDCDDARASANPGASEACGDAVDNDCDGQTDEQNALGCSDYHRDSDGDHYGAAESRCLCAPAAPFDVAAGGDCDDNAAAIHPAALEACNGRDDNCDQLVDEPGASGCQDFHLDTDLDGFGVDDDVQCLCAAAVPYGAARGGDCDDKSPFVNPDADEVCNQVDDDCNGQTDEGVSGTCSPFFYDGDGDGWGLADDSRCLCGPDGLYRAVKAGDCDDAVATTHPFAGEVCNGVDDDCDAKTDEAGAAGCTTWYRDLDHDQVGSSLLPQCLCAASAPFTATVGGDCDEADATVKPGVAETCNGKDDDCDGVTDPAGASGCASYLRDSDGDGYGLANDALCLCQPLQPFTATVAGDCNDADASISPGDVEVCNGRDDDCTGVADDPGTSGCITFFRDDDQDGFGKDLDSRCLCAPAAAYRATTGGDCNDARDDINPALSEACNGFDDDCDGHIDDAGAAGCSVFLKDQDGDLHGVDGNFQCLCAAGPIYRATDGGDCDDARANVYGGATEVCDGLDNDCDGQTDERDAGGCTSYLADVDGDGFGKSGDARCLCAPTDSYKVVVGGDCNDGSTLVSPAAQEFCNGTDDDCDGQTDEENATGCQPFYVDGDHDGWGVGSGHCLCKATGAYVTTQAGDCADDDAARSPGLTERCGGDGKDEDCDGQTDEPNATLCSDHYRDQDGDGYGVTLSKTCTCGASGTLTATLPGDCKDSDDLVNPGESETCNAKDDDCDGLVDEGCGLMSASGSWPTSKYDRRRTGFGSPFNGPTTKTVRWKRQLLPNYDIQTSAVFDGQGRMYIVIKNTAYRLNPADGTTVWSTTLPADMSPAAGPTLRNGGTMVVPTGNGLTLLDLDGHILWDVRLPGTDAEPITGSAMVDDDGTSYMAGFSAAYAIDAGGHVKWSVPVPNQEYVQSHVAWSPTNDRLYFGCSNHTLFAVTRAGQIAWTYVILGEDVDASTVIAGDGTLWQSFGNKYHHVRDDGTTPTKLGEVNNGDDNDTPAALWKDSAGKEHVIANANGTSGLKSWNPSTHAIEWTYAMTKDGEIPNTTPAIDKNGRVYVGDDAKQFHCVKSDGTAQWVFTQADGLVGSEIETTVSLQEKAVFFGDNKGYLYCIADP